MLPFESDWDVVLKDRKLNIRRIRAQHIGKLATRIAVLASLMYQKVHMGENGCANE